MCSVQKEESIEFHSQNHVLSSHDAKNKAGGRWNHEEHLKFLDAIVRYGKDWRKVQESVFQRTGAQVRSHAQKYFLKINKIIKDRKKIKGKKMPSITDTELQLQNYFADHPLTVYTPKEIIELLKIQKAGIKKLIEGNCNSCEKIKIQQLLTPTIKSEKKKQKKAEFSKPNSKIIESIENQVNDVHEDSSFLALIIRKNKDFFFNGGSFAAFIDYGIISKKEKTPIDEQETNTFRKHSFQQFNSQAYEE